MVLKRFLNPSSSISVLTLLVLGAALPAHGQMVTLFQDGPGGPTSPWTIQGGAASDLMTDFLIAQTFTSFPVFNDPQLIADFNNSGLPAGARGTLVKVGSISSTGTVGIASNPVMLSATFTTPLFPNTDFKIKMTLLTPMFDAAAMFINDMKIDFDPNAAPLADNFWISWTTTKIVSAQPGTGRWVKFANAQLNGKRVPKSVAKKIEQYLAAGKIIKVETPQWSHFRLDPPPPPPGGGNNQVDLDFTITDSSNNTIPTISEWGLITLGLLVLSAGTLVIRHRHAGLPFIA